MALFFRKKKKQTEEPTDIKEGLDKSSSSLLGGLKDIFKKKEKLDEDVFEDLEDTLITSDIGVDASVKMIEDLRKTVKSEGISNLKEAISALRLSASNILQSAEQEWQTEKHKPYVILMVGINGVGKTTTTAKIAHYFQQQGKTVMLAAADTFRAAAVEQLVEWGERLNIPVIKQEGTDAAAVAHDALSSAIAKEIDILLIDTAGRLHTQSDLMEQLEKINRVLAKLDNTCPHEVMQILDAGTGQNAISQLEHFQKAVGVSSICLTKLDGSAKGGIAIGLTEKFNLPIRFIGIGEAFEDLRPFNATQFANALLPEPENQ